MKHYMCGIQFTERGIAMNDEFRLELDGSFLENVSGGAGQDEVSAISYLTPANGINPNSYYVIPSTARAWKGCIAAACYMTQSFLDDSVYVVQCRAEMYEDHWNPASPNGRGYLKRSELLEKAPYLVTIAPTSGI